MNSPAPDTAAPILLCKGLAKRYEDAGLLVEVLKDINLAVARGERIAIVGRSGAGKSTLLHLLGGLDVPTAGEVWIEGENMARLNQRRRGKLRNRSLGFIYQFHHLLPEFTAVENVAMPLLVRREDRESAFAKAAALLEKVGLGERRPTSRGSSRAASASAPRWPAPWSAHRAASWPTSPRETWTRTRRRGFTA